MITIAVIAALLVLIFISASYSILIYNGLVALKNNVEKSWGNIDVLLKQRYDEIPKLVESCKGYMKHERETLEAVINARNMLSRAKTSDEYMGSQSELTNALKSLFVIAEKYPELKADNMFARLQSRITDLEDSIADRREMYNEVVTIYNIRLENFPDLFIASLFKFQPKLLWEINPLHREDVSISFN